MSREKGIKLNILKIHFQSDAGSEAESQASLEAGLEVGSAHLRTSLGRGQLRVASSHSLPMAVKSNLIIDPILPFGELTQIFESSAL